MCGGFTCSKNALIALNLLYVVIAFILIGVALYGRASAIVTNLPIISGILVCGIILIVISILGLIGALSHHQVILFFYMLILFLLFLIQFSIACACLAVNSKQQKGFADSGWNKVDFTVKKKVQETFHCCGFNDTVAMDYSTNILSKPFKLNNELLDCSDVNQICCSNNPDIKCRCPSCMHKLQDTIDYSFKLCGGVGLFFSFTEFIGVWLTVRYRNQKDPRANPSAFL